MKKALILFLCCCMVFALAACGGGSDTPVASSNAPVTLQSSEIQAALSDGGKICQAPGGFFFTDSQTGIFYFDRLAHDKALILPGCYLSIVLNGDYIYANKPNASGLQNLVRISLGDYKEELVASDIGLVKLLNIIDGKLYFASYDGMLSTFDFGSQSIVETIFVDGVSTVSERGIYYISGGMLFLQNFSDGSCISFDQLSNYYVGKVYYENAGYLIMKVVDNYGEYLCSLNLESGEFYLHQSRNGELGSVMLMAYPYLDQNIYFTYNDHYGAGVVAPYLYRADYTLQQVNEMGFFEDSTSAVTLDSTLIVANVVEGMCHVSTMIGVVGEEMANAILLFPTNLDNVYANCEEPIDLIDMSKVNEALSKNNVYSYIDADNGVCTAKVGKDGTIDFSYDNPNGESYEWSTTWTAAGSYYDLQEPDELTDPVQLLWDYSGDKFLIELNDILTFMREEPCPAMSGTFTNEAGMVLDITRDSLVVLDEYNMSACGYINVAENVLMLYENNEYGRLDSYYGPYTYVVLNKSYDNRVIGITYDYGRTFDGRGYDDSIARSYVGAWSVSGE